MSGVPPFFPCFLVKSFVYNSLYSGYLACTIVHVMHCMALVHHMHGLPTYMVPGTYLPLLLPACMLLGGYHMICSTLNNWESTYISRFRIFLDF